MNLFFVITYILTNNENYEMIGAWISLQIVLRPYYPLSYSNIIAFVVIFSAEISLVGPKLHIIISDESIKQEQQQHQELLAGQIVIIRELALHD